MVDFSLSKFYTLTDFGSPFPSSDWGYTRSDFKPPFPSSDGYFPNTARDHIVSIPDYQVNINVGEMPMTEKMREIKRGSLVTHKDPAHNREFWPGTVLELNFNERVLVLGKNGSELHIDKHVLILHESASAFDEIRLQYSQVYSEVKKIVADLEKIVNNTKKSRTLDVHLEDPPKTYGTASKPSAFKVGDMVRNFKKNTSGKVIKVDWKGRDFNVITYQEKNGWNFSDFEYELEKVVETPPSSKFKVGDHVRELKVDRLGRVISLSRATDLETGKTNTEVTFSIGNGHTFTCPDYELDWVENPDTKKDQIRVVSDGTKTGTKIFKGDEELRNVVTAFVRIDHEGCKITLDCGTINNSHRIGGYVHTTGDAEIRIYHPDTGRSEPVRYVEFMDGTIFGTKPGKTKSDEVKVKTLVKPKVTFTGNREIWGVVTKVSRTYQKDLFEVMWNDGTITNIARKCFDILED